MRSRPLAVILLALASPTAACQLLWSYDDFKDQPGSGGSGGAPASTTTASLSSTGGGAPSSSSSSGGPCMGGPVGMACTDPCDQMAVVAHQFTIQPDVKQCTVAVGGAANPSCVAMTDGLSTACATCWAELGHCGALHCFALGPCSGDVDSTGCNDCLAKNCDCAFEACSGTVRPAKMDAGADASCD